MADNKELRHYYYTQSTKLVKNKYNILEPIDFSEFDDLSKIDIIIIPLLAYDKFGNRVGYGGGYYDKFLVKCKYAIKVGVSMCFSDIIIKDIEKYDIKLDCCIINNEIITFSDL